MSTVTAIFKLPRIGRPRVKDALPFLFSLGGLLLTGLFVWLLGRFLPFVLPPEDFVLAKPAGVIEWAKIIVFCLLVGYWEEGFFRMYFLTVCRRAGIPKYAAVLISTLVFALCHSYEGVPGLINAGIAGVLLSCVYLKTESYHGIAAAHAAYNVLAYVLA
ncbi:MAG: CPBP family intramembrane metalloprotease [Spirochaetaceae bacterium]|nr:CPBP family intramembrane metalloprotease [Spirochaetaceae bacterium]